ncbi:MAG: nitrogen fixation protein [Gammaproteobacteria bacterium]|nr:nitrogen fixation protein [Gammaproteobacteria bacterium]MBU1416115.1 nitrogen fixation protein [Gammaproteobacteria bacterium]
MRIAVSSQNFRQVTGHAGHARRFLVFNVDGVASIELVDRLDLPKELAIHGFDDRVPHPLYGMDVLITGGAGEGFKQRLAQRGVQVVATAETDPEVAVRAFMAGHLSPPLAQDHDHGGQHDHDHEGGCGCHG